jgi:hypothetical protein
MSKVTIQGNASGTGTFTIAAPNSNTDRTLNLPDEAGTVLTSSGPVTVDSSAPANSLNIDANGYVTRPNVPAFRVASPSQTITATGEHTLQWATVTSASNTFLNGFTESSGLLYPAVSGLYFCTAVVRIDGISSGYVILKIMKNSDQSNSSESYTIENSPNSTYDFLTGSFLTEMTPSDYLEITIATSSDTNYNVVSTSTFMGYMIG